ncbi:MAG: hypothetical protein LBH30_03995 [Prevotellaceae bacterium]|jgi:hypothetical protein|nr:hypothetical protein [Prevotellaceae bacterium]
MDELKKCPYCGEEILPLAKKCKHCNEWLKKEVSSDNSNKKNQEETDDESLGFGGRMICSLILVGVGWALFYFGSWHLIFGKKISIMLQYLSSGTLKMQNFILEDSGFVFRINEKYYGFVKDAHFFDSPFIQWAMLFISLCAFYYAIHNLIFGDE